jgi:hypothetical protein
MTHRTSTTAIALLCAASWLGCSSTMARRQPLSHATIAELNDELQGHEATVVASDRGKQEHLSGEYVVVEPEVTHLLERPLGDVQPRSRTVPTAALQQITVIKRGPAVAGGLALGFVLGVAGGAALGALAGQSSSSGSAVGALGGGLLGLFLGPPIGALIGVSVGYRTTFELSEHASPSERELPAAGERCAVDKLGTISPNAEGRMLRCWDSFGDGHPRWTAQ